MTLRKNDAEGQTSGTALTAGNSGVSPDDAFDFVIKTVTGAINFDSSQSWVGTKSYHVVAAAGDTAYVEYDNAGDSSAAGRVYFRWSSMASIAGDIFGFRNSTGYMCKYTIGANNKLVLQGSAGAFHTFPTALAAGQWYRLEMQSIIGTTTSNGTANAAYYLGDSLTPVDPAYTSGATLNTGTTNIVRMQAGKLTANTFTMNAWMDAVAWNNGTSTAIGPPSSGSSVTQNVQPYDLVTLPAGTWTQTSGATQTLSSNTFVARAKPAGEILIYTSGANTQTIIIAPHSVFRIGVSGLEGVKVSKL